MIEQEQFCALPRMELCEAKVGRDRHSVMLGNRRTGTPWQVVAPELKLAKKVTADKGGAGPSLPRIVVERAPEVEPKRFYVLSADIEAHGHTGGCPGCAALASHGKATKPHNDECRERIRTIIERTLTGKSKDERAQGQNRRDRASQREEKSSS